MAVEPVAKYGRRVEMFSVVGGFFASTDSVVGTPEICVMPKRST